MPNGNASCLMASMNTLNIKVYSGRSSEILDFLPYLLGKTVALQNGCKLFFDDIDSDFYVPCTTPYGIDVFCTSVESLTAWLDYWDQPRTETGLLIEDLVAPL